MAAENATFSPFSCHDAMYHLCKRSRKKMSLIQQELNYYLHESFVTMCKSHFYVIYELIKMSQVPLCAIGRKRCGTRHQYLCLVDMRHTLPIKSNIPPLYWIIDVDTGLLLKKQHKCPKYHASTTMSESMLDLQQAYGIFYK